MADVNTSNDAAQPVNLAQRFAASPRFDMLFDDGMALIEETAAYLDNEGRLAAKDLEADAAALYGSESMRLTTRLMQLASWLLLQRSVTEGEMTPDEAATEKQTIKLNRMFTRPQGGVWGALPEEFRGLIDRANAMQRRVAGLDRELYGDGEKAGETANANAVAAQQSLLETAFDRRFSR
ncbi:MAG: DUF1465 family protein [Pseudomonadota bacterium]